jgi:hypothetical protein
MFPKRVPQGNATKDGGCCQNDPTLGSCMSHRIEIRLCPRHGTRYRWLHRDEKVRNLNIHSCTRSCVVFMQYRSQECGTYRLCVPSSDLQARQDHCCDVDCPSAPARYVGLRSIERELLTKTSYPYKGLPLKTSETEAPPLYTIDSSTV